MSAVAYQQVLLLSINGKLGSHYHDSHYPKVNRSVDTATFYEIIGYLASALVAGSLLMRSIYRLRIINVIGAITFTIYGLLIDAFPIVLTNAIIVLINAYYLNRMFRSKDYFRLLEIDAGSSGYLREFFSFYRKDILNIQPGFDFDIKSGYLSFLILRNVRPVGIFVAEQDGDALNIYLDYVLEDYRDFKAGQFIFRENEDMFRKMGIKKFVAKPASDIHLSYIKRIGFVPSPDTADVYVKLI